MSSTVCIEWLLVCVFLFVVSTLISWDEGDILGSRRDTQDLVAIDLPLHLCQVAKGTCDACRKVWNIAHLHQQLHMVLGTRQQCFYDVAKYVIHSCLNMENVQQR